MAFLSGDPSAGAHGDNNLALLSIGIALLGTLIGSVWKFSSMTTKFDLAIKHLKKSEREQNRTMRGVPQLERRIERCEDKLGINPHGSRPDSTEVEGDDEDDDDDEDSG